MKVKKITSFFCVVLCFHKLVSCQNTQVVQKPNILLISVEPEVVEAYEALNVAYGSAFIAKALNKIGVSRSDVTTITNTSLKTCFIIYVANISVIL